MGYSPSVRSSVRQPSFRPNQTAQLTPLRQDWSEISGPFLSSFLPASDLLLLPRRTAMVMVMGAEAAAAMMARRPELAPPAHVGWHSTGRAVAFQMELRLQVCRLTDWNRKEGIGGEFFSNVHPVDDDFRVVFRLRPSASAAGVVQFRT